MQMSAEGIAHQSSLSIILRQGDLLTIWLRLQSRSISRSREKTELMIYMGTFRIASLGPVPFSLLAAYFAGLTTQTIVAYLLGGWDTLR